MSDITIPSFGAMMNPTLETLRNLGGSATIDEIYEEITILMGFSEGQLQIIHKPEKSTRTEIEYRLAWTRTYLKKYGLLENSSRGVWALTAIGNQTEWVDEKEVVRTVREANKSKKVISDENPSEEDDAEITWREELMETLLQITPDAFERLFQRILRESGFIQVEVTGRSGDGGIDGNGIIRLGGLLSFSALFQCKRYKNPIGAGIVRDFRGAMMGRTDKGLIVTTSRFTRAAEAEATRDGAPTIDLIDGEHLLDLLKDLDLGVSTKVIQVEEVEINHDWFFSL